MLAARGTKLVCLTLRDGRVFAEQPAVARAKRIASLPSGAILTIAGDGKAKLATDRARSANAGFNVVELAVCKGIAYAGGWHGALARLDEASATWSDLGLAAAIAPHLPDDGPSAKSKVHSIIEGAAGPIVGVYCTYFETIVLEWNGAAWKLRGKVEGRINALARSPADDVVYAVGEQLSSIDARGKVRRLAKLDDDEQWSCGWLHRKAGGILLAADLGCVSQLSLDGKLTELLPWGAGEVPDNHSLFVSGARAAFVCGGVLHVLDGKKFSPVPLGT